jgi:squalene-associated FAD-dependent desaturase
MTGDSGPAGRVAVVGGGLAGITAALRLADAGRAVTLFEGRAVLGGLTHSFRRGALDVDNGQHVFLRCCTAYRGLLDRLGVADKVALQRRLDIPIRSPHRPGPASAGPAALSGIGSAGVAGRPRRAGAARLRRNGLPAPLHLGATLLRYPLLDPVQRLSFVRAALALRRVDRTDPAVDRRSFGDWLRAHGQDARAITALWDVVGIATLNAPAQRASLALAAMVFQVGLLTDAGAADIGWSLVPLGQLHGDAALRCLTDAGVAVMTGTRVGRVEKRGDAWVVGAGGEKHVVDQVVLAVPPPVAQTLLPPGTVALPEGWAERLGSSPIVNAHVVLDRKVMDVPFVAGVATPVQWVFDRTVQSGLTGGGQYLAMSLSAADDIIDVPVRTLRERLLPELVALLPEADRATVLDFFVSRERHATFRPEPGSGALRPPARTASPGLFLAGAWTDTGWPATMEGAVRSGESAAAAALAASVPPAREAEPELRSVDA